MTTDEDLKLAAPEHTARHEPDRDGKR